MLGGGGGTELGISALGVIGVHTEGPCPHHDHCMISDAGVACSSGWT